VIGFLHSDDLFADSNALSRVALAFEDTYVDAVYGDLMYVRSEDPNRVVRYWRAGEFSKSLLSRGWMPPHPTFYARRSCYDRIGTFDTSYLIAADYEHMLRVLTNGNMCVKYIPQVLVRMRLGGISNRSLKNIIQKSREDFRALRSHDVGGLGALIWKNIRKLPQFTRTLGGPHILSL
jgi:glycosyltransferase